MRKAQICSASRFGQFEAPNRATSNPRQPRGSENKPSVPARTKRNVRKRERERRGHELCYSCPIGMAHKFVLSRLFESTSNDFLNLTCLSFFNFSMAGGFETGPKSACIANEFNIHQASQIAQTDTSSRRLQSRLRPRVFASLYHFVVILAVPNPTI